MQSLDSRRRWALFCMLLGVYLVFYIDKPDSLDGEALLSVSAALVRTGSPNMNSIAYTDWIMPAGSGMGSVGVDGAVYSKKGIVPSLALMPFVVTSDTLPHLTTRATAMFFNPIITALTAVVLYTLLRRMRFSERTAFITCLLYGLTTFALVYTKTLFGEPLTALLLLTAALHTYRYCEQPRARDAVSIGVCIGLLIGINTIYALYAPLFGLMILRQRSSSARSWLVNSAGYMIPILTCITLLALFNAARFGNVFDSGYRFAEGEGFIHPIADGLYGLFISPYRGVFWYNPILLLAIPGTITLMRANSQRGFTTFVLVTIAAQALMFASWWSWHGGIVWGARFLIPVTPLMMLIIAPILEAAGKHRWLLAPVILLMLVSFIVQMLGALFSYLPHNAYLFAHHYTGDYSSIVTLLDPRILSDMTLSPLVGHLVLLLSGWSLEPVALHEMDEVHLALAILVFVMGTLMLVRRIAITVCILIVVLALNGIGARRANAPETARIRVLNDVMQPAGTVLALTTAYGAALIDLETRHDVITINAPITYRDQRALILNAYARRQYDRLWFVTWYSPADSDNWLERALFGTQYFAGERAIAGHRALAFTAPPTPIPQDTPGAPHAVAYQFGAIRLRYVCIDSDDTDIFVRLTWETTAPLFNDYQWFAHLIDENGNILAQLDRQPLGGYAPTRSWTPFWLSEPTLRQWRYSNMRFTDSLYFSFSPAATAIRIGWVDPVTGTRLPIIRDGAETPETFHILGLNDCPMMWLPD